MAKSLRAKSHLKAKSVKRHAVFQKVVDARETRLAEKLKQDFINQKVKELKEKDGEDVTMEIDNVGAADISEGSTKNGATVSTSGWRDARHLNYRRSKKAKKTGKKGSFTKF
ncbi:uncharacterized protein KNAG_0H00960 [Huiozyma naganishii CBS 8797]|uniref:DUF2423 domain-containing protein n=1 Tax=Huiozyma naganishii (strain ATCC MYA-139 / BCRC 22969 / CBS 8797 / KCTC 17520 / NBRC 10181 / NCYC 3082 / Yp74L-3) TaxID=1071383 RepID=J7S9I5_HUIN7|nr:hypothetical protein KNAG_0H00960 [Kazachstania naganishii CBS 8797]CCK71511.1 hypothetical protein KNAG_0H00960 [Kazachstania naganishii CBS 8797]